MKHPDHVPGWGGSLEDLARAVIQMRYDKVAEFMDALARCLYEDQEADRKRGRKKLAGWLLLAAHDLGHVKRCINRAWTICQPRMAREPQSSE